MSQPTTGFYKPPSALLEGDQEADLIRTRPQTRRPATPPVVAKSPHKKKRATAQEFVFFGKNADEPSSSSFSLASVFRLYVWGTPLVANSSVLEVFLV